MGRRMSTEESPQVVEEVEDSEINKNTSVGITDLRNEQSLKDGVYRKLKQQINIRWIKGATLKRVIMEESENHTRNTVIRSIGAVGGKSIERPMIQNPDVRVEMKAKIITVASPSDAIVTEGKGLIVRDESRGVEQSQSRHKNCDDLHTDLPDQTHKHKKSRQMGGTSNKSEDEIMKSSLL
ncbi:hypothetical protein GOP47_0021317 [Adiantum capillus-veneris]|uniref:Uncharacterized protein n=1 Tax=Adiantum capillus-veneris TaxID=13818 RepID=A0A9D4UBN4_ADICA|nr:hypothetical protein GOP47_0021317 [Adiantum capillus-veneris]